MKNITKIKLFNFKRFENLTIEFNNELNLLIGDNEAGKSSILLAIDIVLSGSRSKVEALGLETIFTNEVVQGFLTGAKRYSDLPKVIIELYLNEQNDPDLNGVNNSDRVACDGLILCCEPDDNLSAEIATLLTQSEPNFPFEYYTISFKTFSGQHYTGYRKFLKHVLIDSSQINNEHATREYIKNMYHSVSTNIQRHKHANDYRTHKGSFTTRSLVDVNTILQPQGYQFTIRSGSKSNLNTDITLNENSINIENKGKGRQCFIKTDFALQRQRNGNALDIVLLEEPENHLSHIHMKKLIEIIRGTNDKQLFVSTHNSLVSTRLDLRRSILLNSTSAINTALKDLSEETAKFFMKAPDNNVIEFVLSDKVILVEGDAEYILMDLFCRKVLGGSLDSKGLHVIAVDGTSFKRYLQLAAKLGIRTAVITDNDGNYSQNIEENYRDYRSNSIAIFSDNDNDRRTFETCMYLDNQTVCNEVFEPGRRTLTVREYMLKNKTEAAFVLLDTKANVITTPNYIKSALEWISE